MYCMIRSRFCVSASAVLFAACLPVAASLAQTPEQQQMWDAQRVQAVAEAKAKAERLAQELSLIHI